MAGTPQYGGTNGVAEMDIGTPGIAGGRYASNEAHFRAKVVRHAPEVAQVQHGIPQQNLAFIDQLGWRGQLVTWVGSVVVKDVTELGLLSNQLELFLTGVTVNVTTGVRSYPDTTYLAGTILKDAYGIAEASSAIMVGYQFRDNWKVVSGSSLWSYLNHLSVVFRILG